MFDQIYQYNFPTTIRFGAGVINELSDYLKKNNLKSPLLVTDPVVAKLDFFSQIKASLERNQIHAEVFDQIHKNPVKSDVYAGTTVFDETKRDSIIGIGGGAALERVSFGVPEDDRHRGHLPLDREATDGGAGQ